MNMKMSDYFPEAFEVKHNKSFEVQNCHWVTFGEDFHSNCEQDDAIAYAVLNHDRLTSENARLREALHRLARSSTEVVDISGASDDVFFEYECALDKSVALLNELEKGQ